MRDYLMAEDSEVWDIICKVPYVPTTEVKDGEVTRVIPKTRKQYNDSDRLLVQKNHKARKLLMCGLSINEYDLISSCESAKEIWDLLKTKYEGTEKIRKSKVDFFSTQFEDFSMNDGELIHEVRTRFSKIIDELMFLEEPVPIVKTADGEEKEGDQVCSKISRREFFFREVKRELAAWEKSSSDSDDSENTDNGFMAKSDEEDSDEKVSLSYFKQNLNTFSTSKLRKLAVVLLDLISEMKDEKDLVNNNLDISQDGKIALVAQISDIKSQMLVLEAKNLELKKRMKGVTNKTFKGKNEASSLQLELENKLHTAEMKTKIALERNLELERDLVRVKEELEKSLKWTNSSKILTNLVGQENNSRRGGLGCDKIESSYNPRRKNVPDADNLLSENCCRDGNHKKDCPILEKFEGGSSNYSKQLKRAKERHVKFVRSENNQEKKERGPGLRDKVVRFDSNMIKRGQGTWSLLSF